MTHPSTTKVYTLCHVVCTYVWAWSKDILQGLHEHPHHALREHSGGLTEETCRRLCGRPWVVVWKHVGLRWSCGGVDTCGQHAVHEAGMNRHCVDVVAHADRGAPLPIHLKLNSLSKARIVQFSSRHVAQGPFHSKYSLPAFYCTTWGTTWSTTTELTVSDPSSSLAIC